MDAARTNGPRVMWEPDRSKETQTDKLRKIINAKCGTAIGKTTSEHVCLQTVAYNTLMLDRSAFLLLVIESPGHTRFLKQVCV